MQQTRAYWRVMAVAGVVGAFVASACVVTSGTDDSSAGTGGTETTTGGTSSGGTTSVGGTGGSSGSTSIAGTGGSATGGTSGTAVACDMGEAGAMTGTPATNCNATAGDDCSTCIQSKCCGELEICNGTNPNNQCAFGGPTNAGEFTCVAACMKKAFSDNGGVELPDDLPTCAGNCGTDACGSVIGTSTNNLIACVHADGLCTDASPPCSCKCFQ